MRCVAFLLACLSFSGAFAPELRAQALPKSAVSQWGHSQSTKFGTSRITRIGNLANPEGTTTGIFKVQSVTVRDPISGAPVKKLFSGVVYDLVAVVEVPFDATIPWIWQIEFGKAAGLDFLVEEAAFPSAGVYFIENTVELDTFGRWGISIALGGNRTKTSKVKVIG